MRCTVKTSDFGFFFLQNNTQRDKQGKEGGMCQPTCLLALSEIKVIFTEMSHQVFCFSIFRGLHQRGDEACTLKAGWGGWGGMLIHAELRVQLAEK